MLTRPEHSKLRPTDQGQGQAKHYESQGHSPKAKAFP